MAMSFFCRANVRYKIIEYINNLEDFSTPIKIKGINSKAVPMASQNNVVKYDEVLNDLDQVIKLSPKFAGAHYNRGNINTYSRNFSEAINDYTKAIELEPEMGEAYYNRGLIRVFLENQQGCQDLSKSGELGVTEAYNVIKRYCND